MSASNPKPEPPNRQDNHQDNHQKTSENAHPNPNYEHEDTHDHDEHLEQTTAPRDTRGYQRTLLFSFIIITGYMFIEAIGGWLTGSLALLSDACLLYTSPSPRD